MSTPTVSPVEPLQTELAQYRAVIAALNQGVVWLDAQGQISHYNSRWASWCPNPRPLQGQTWPDVMPLRQGGRLLAASDYPEARFRRGQTGAGIYDYREESLQIWGGWIDRERPDLGTFWLMEVIPADGGPAQALARELQRSQAFLQTLIDNIPLALFVKDGRPDTFGQFQFWNQTCERMFGISAEQALGKTVYDISPLEQAQFFEQKDHQAFEQGHSEEIPEEFIDTPHQGQRILHTRKIPLYDEAQQPQHLLVICEDITDRKRSEQAFLESETRLRVLYDSISLGIITGNDEGIFDCNNAAEILFRCSRQYIIGKHPSRLSPPQQPNGRSSQELANEYIQQAFAQGSHRFEWIHRRADGTDFLAEVWLTPIQIGDRRLVQGIIYDLTERKRTEEALRRSELKYRNLFENSQVGIFRTRVTDGLVLEANQRFIELGGYQDPSEVVGKLRTLDFYADPSDRERIVAQLQQQGELGYYELRFRRHDQSLRWGLCSVRLNREENCLEGVMLDISDRKQAEMALADSERRLQQQSQALASLAQSQALALGQLDLALRAITEAAASSLRVERVGIWLFDRDHTKLRCADLYELPDDRHSLGLELCIRDYPSYCEALQTSRRSLSFPDAQNDPRLQELLDSYLIPLGIQANLDAPIRVKGKIVGVVCHEQIQAPRVWTLAEQNFAGSIADFVALALETHQRQQVQAMLERNNALLKAQRDASPEGILVVNEQHQIISYNQRFRDLWQIPPAVMTGDNAIPLREYVLSKLAEPEEFKAKLDYLYQSPLEISRDEIPFKDGRILERYSSPIHSSQGDYYGRVWYFQDITHRKQREQALRLIVEGTAAKIGNDFFRSCVRSLVELLKVRYALIAEFTDASKRRARTFAVWTGKDFGENFEYDIAGTPCEAILQGRMVCYSDAVQTRFPEDIDLVKLGVESYVSMPLLNPAGDILGHIAALDTKPLDEPNFEDQKLILKIFAARAGAELERLRTEMALEQQLQRALLLEQITQNIRQSLDLGRISCTAVNQIGQSFQVDGCQIFSYQADNQAQVVAEYRKPCSHIGNEESLQLADVAGLDQALTQDQAVIWQADDDPTHLDQRMDIQSLIAIRTSYQSEPNGAIVVYQRHQVRHWSQGEIELLEAVAAQVGIAIAQGQLLAQEKRQRRDLEAAKRSAESANRAKSEFLAHMSHELRTPLNAIIGFAQLMERDTTLSPQQQESLAIINRSGEHLLNLINDVLEMSKIEAGQTRLHPTSFDFQHLLQALQELFQPRAQEKGLFLQMDLPPTLPQFIRADEGKLRQVLINLLSNALKFTETGGVTLRVNLETPGQLYFAVEDTGRGIAAADLAQLFLPFVQAGRDGQNEGGTGLGLAISRKFVQLMGGDIQVRSQPGQGSVFSFTLPLIVTPPGKVPTNPVRRRVIGLLPDQPQYRILVVDDGEENRQLLARLLASVGLETRTAANGEEAIAVWQAWQPHLIWMDMRMPVMDGYEATQRIKRSSQGPTPIIIALTATAFEEQRAGILAMGCDDMVRKPFQESIIFDKMAQYLGLKYLYADPSLPPRRITLAPLSPQALQSMTPDWLQALRQAAVEVDGDWIETLLAQIPPVQARLTEALIRLTHDYDFDAIIKLADEALNRESH
ncbi:PAS domain S-box protein [Synechocystis sp. LKSZ1]|uniref:PAS domain S-box protein n=1 Tax=Synechocystis sp. LKSZ1 TaxID=3144951 RepID=UPI00336C0B04